MNISYQVVWNSATNSWVVASELATSKKKAGSGKVIAATTLLAVSGSALASGLDAIAIEGMGIDVEAQHAASPTPNAPATETIAAANEASVEPKGIQAVAPMAFATPFAPSHPDDTVLGNSAGAGRDLFDVAGGGEYLPDGVVEPVTAVGARAGQNFRGENSVFFGADAGSNMVAAVSPSGVVGLFGVTAVGSHAGAGSTSGGMGTYLGSYAGSASNGTLNVFTGHLSGAESVGDHNVAVGALSFRGSQGRNNTAIGYNALSNMSVTDSIAIGYRANSTVGTGNFTVAVGNETIVTAERGVALGSGSQTTHYNSVAIGAGSVTTAAHSVSVGAPGAERLISNLAPGAVNATSTDGVNGSQLHTTNQTVGALNTRVGSAETNIAGITTSVINVNAEVDNLGTRIAAGFGGAAAYDPATGTWTKPAFQSIRGNASRDNVHDALRDVEDGFTAVDTRIDQLADNAVQYDSAAQDSVTLGGVGATSGVLLSNVADGDVGAASRDAINGSQLFVATNNLTAEIGDSETRVTNRLNDLGEAMGGTFGGTAVYDPATGAWTKPSFVVRGQTANSVTDAFNLVEGGLVAIEGNVTNSVNEVTEKVHDLGHAIAGQLGGSVAYDEVSGTLSAADYRVANQTYLDVDTAVEAIDVGMTKLDTRIDNITSGAAGLVQHDAANNRITVAADIDAASVSLAGNGVARTLTDVADGDVSATSQDAINGSQLFAATSNLTTEIGDSETRVTNRVNDLGEAMRDTFGGTAAYDPATGTWTAPTFTVRGQTASTVTDAFALVDGGFTQIQTDITNIQNGSDTRFNDLGHAIAGQLGGSVVYDDVSGTFSAADYLVDQQGYTDVDSAIEAVDGSLTSINTRIDNITSGAAGLVQHDAANNRITVAADIDAASVSLAGNGVARTLTDLADGDVSATSQDAINGSQLFAATSNLSTEIGDSETRVTNRVNDLGEAMRDTFGGTAAYDPATGTWTAPDFTVRGQTASTVTDAFALVDGGFTQIQTDITNIQSGSDTRFNDLGHAIAGQLGGSVVYDDVSGTFSAADYLVDQQAYTDVDSAIEAVDGSLTSINTRIDNITSGATGLVQHDVANNRITVAADIDAASVSLAGNGVARTLTDVADGDVSATSQDAINGSQLFAATSNLSTEIGDSETRVTNRVNDLGEAMRDTFGGTAAYDPATGTWTAPDFTVRGQTANTVTRAFDLVNDGFVAMDDLITQMSGNVVHYDSAARDAITLGGAGSLTLVRLANLAAGSVSSTSTDAINGSQLHRATQDIATVLGGGAGLDAKGNLTGPSYRLGENDTAYNNVGDAIESIDGHVIKNTMDIATITTQIVQGTVGLVQQDKDDANRKLTVGKDVDGTVVDFANVTGTARTLVGIAAGEVSAASTQAINGSQLHGTAQSIAGAFGGSATVDGAGEVTGVKFTIGGQDYYTVDSAFGAIQSGFNGGTLGLVRQDQASRVITVAKETDGTVVSIEGTEGNRTLAGVANGTVSADSTQAVNGSQLHATNTRLDGLETKVGEIDSRVTNMEGDVTEIRNSIADGNLGLVKQDETTREIRVAADRDGAVVNMAGTAGDRQITGVANGTVTQGSNDAVNGGQVHALAHRIADHLGGGATVNADGTISAPAYSVGGQSYGNVGGAIDALDRRVDDWGYAMSGRIDDVERQSTKGIAAASALMVTTPYAPGSTAMNAGVASYRGEAALGIGISRWSDNGRWNWNAGVSSAKGDQPVFRVGVGIIF